ncbi:MAG: imelysin family protein [Alphaproteobacteria bacterium]
MRVVSLFICLALLSPGILAKPARAGQDHFALIESVIDNAIIPDYENFAVATAEMRQVFEESACDDLKSLRATYNTGMDAWQPVSHIRFGPAMQEDRSYRIQFWPDKRNITSRHLASLISDTDPATRTVDGIVGASVAIQGFPALERLLFDMDDGQELTPPACTLARSIAINLANIADEIASEWRESYRTTMLQPGPDNPEYRNQNEALKKLHGSLSTGLQLVVDVKLQPVMGKSVDEAKPRLAESWRSARSMRNLIINIEAVQRYYEGGNAHALGFDDSLLERGGQEEHAVIAFGLKQSLKWAKDLDMPIADIVSPDGYYTKLGLIAGQLAAVRAEVDGPLVNALGLSMGFNALDGD